MRVVHTFNRYLLAAVLLGATLMAVDTVSAAERRVIVTNDSDYAGFDTKTVKGVDLPACQTACLADKTCKAFTFNTKAGWCFLKSDFGELAASTGAVGGRVVDAVDLTPTLERRRLGELTFLDQTLIDEAHAQI